MAKQGQADRFHQGTMTDGWRWFGAHPAKKRGRDGWTFRVWAPMRRRCPSWATSTTGRRERPPRPQGRDLGGLSAGPAGLYFL
ncbi:MAG: hypothetical protein ACLTYN_06300 [Dysosmobacter welbionis]